MSDILCVTNRALCREDFLTRIDRIAAAHPRGILLREKELSEAAYTALARQVLAICQRHGTLCILQHFADAARRLCAPALHLPFSGLAACGDLAGFPIRGASCHTPEEAAIAEKAGCTYIIAGHIFDTDCKKGTPGRGLTFLREMAAAVSIPVYAIGGITPRNLAAVQAAGAVGACVMSSIMTCDDPAAYLARLEESVCR